MGGEFLLLENLGVDADDEDLLVIAAVKDADAAAFGQRFHAAPKVVVIEFLGRGCFEGEDLAALRVEAAHDVLDGAVLAGGVHGLDDDEQGVGVLGVEFVLEFGEGGNAGSKEFGGAVLVNALRGPVGREVFCEGDFLAAGRDGKAVDERTHFEFQRGPPVSTYDRPGRNGGQGRLKRGKGSPEGLPFC